MHMTKFGTYGADSATDGNIVTRDGDTVRVPVMMMDGRTAQTDRAVGAGHAPQMTADEHRAIAAARRDAFYDHRREALQDAWKGGSAPAVPSSWTDRTPPWAREAAQRVNDKAADAAALQTIIDQAQARRDATNDRHRQSLADAWQEGR